MFIHYSLWASSCFFTLSTNLLLYKDGYYQIDGDLHTKLPGKEFTRLHSDLKGSRDKLKPEIELLKTTKSDISDLVSYKGSSHTNTENNYNLLLKQIKSLDTSITQYESSHSSQDLAAFKELLAATKALIAEHSGKSRNVGTYQSGDFGKLKSVQRFALAYDQAAKQMESRVERVKAAQERDKVRFEALARSDKGWGDMAIGAISIIVGVTAIVFTWGTATPLVVATAITAGVGSTAYGVSNMYEASQDIKLGNAGDIQTKSYNLIRDTAFMGNDKLYHEVGNVFVTASAIMIPIGKTQSVVKGVTQFAIGEAGAYTAGQTAYHVTKLARESSNFDQYLAKEKLQRNLNKSTLASRELPKLKGVHEVEVPKYNREQILRNIEESRLARESSGFKDFATRERYLEKVFDKLTPEERELIFNISKNAPKVEYQPDYSFDSVLSMSKNNRPNVEYVYTPEYIKAHKQQFENGAIKFQKFTPEEGGYNNGAVGNEKDHVAFVMPKEAGETLIKVTKGDPELLEDILGLHRGDLGSSPVAIEIPPESIKNPRIPSGNEESAFEDFWKPGGQTFPGNMPEAVIDEVPWGEFTIRKLGGD